MGTEAPHSLTGHCSLCCSPQALQSPGVARLGCSSAASPGSALLSTESSKGKQVLLQLAQQLTLARCFESHR